MLPFFVKFSYFYVMYYTNKNSLFHPTGMHPHETRSEFSVWIGCQLFLVLDRLSENVDPGVFCVAESWRGGSVPRRRPHAVHRAVSTAQVADPAAQILPVGQLLFVLSGMYPAARAHANLFSSSLFIMSPADADAATTVAARRRKQRQGRRGAAEAVRLCPCRARPATPSSVSYIIDLYAATRNTLLVK
jgi:hypothetical protein